MKLRCASRTGETAGRRSINSGAQHEDYREIRLRGAAPALRSARPRLSAQKITFTLNWVAGGDHAPYFYAQKMGWYKQAGLDVDFETGRGSAASAQKVGAGQSQLGLSDMAGVLLFRGKGADHVGLMNVYANSPQGMYWLKSSGINSVKDLAGKKIGNPAGDGARTMWPALAKKVGIDPELGDLGQHRRQRQARRAQGQDHRRHHVVLQPAPRVRARARQRHGLPGVEGRRRESVRQLDHRQRAPGSRRNRDKADKFVKITQKAFADCTKKPDPCIKALVEANGALQVTTTSCSTGISSPS